MKQRPPEKLRRDALSIWQAGVEAVRSDRLVGSQVRVDGGRLLIAGDEFELSAIRRIAVVGAGKAGAGMAAGLEQALGAELASEKQLTGWINVPADCVRPLNHLHLHAARPAGVNEPTPTGAAGAGEILRLLASLSSDDLCIALISGGGSALLPLPAAGISLDDKLAVTRFLSAAGAPIEELNTVRKQLSQIKGGGMARACRAGALVALVISDVLGDPLDLIASGPTVADRSTPAEALAILSRYGAGSAGISPAVFEVLKHEGARSPGPPACRVSNHVIGNNATAVDAAAEQARQFGYAARGRTVSRSEGPAEDVGRQLAGEALQRRASAGPECLVSGGEPTVTLVDPERRGLGGRNQQLVLAAAAQLGGDDAEGLLLLSGGTDGEDGPTDAAGAWIDRPLVAEARRRGLNADEFLARNDAYHWFEPLGGLIKTGPTHTNVCDVRVVLVDRGG